MDERRKIAVVRIRAGENAPKPTRRLPRATLSAQLCEQIRKSILDGTYPLGAQLNEMDLAATFGVSRGPVREGLQRLIQEGLLNSEPHRGVFVPELNDSDISDIYFVRKSLELAAMRRVMALADRTQIQRRLVTVIKQMEKVVQRQNWPLIAELDMEFHRQFVDAAGSFRLSRAYATVQAETKLYLHRLMGSYRGNKALIEEHQTLAELIGGDDADAALAKLNRHFGDPISTPRKANAVRDDQSGEAAA